MNKQVNFGILLPMTSRHLSAGQLLSELTEEVCAAEEAGIDLVLVPEHHVGPPQTLSDPLTIVTWLLSRTSAIKIGTGVLLLPLHSVVQIAEQAALLQHASGGRLVLGVGAGYQQADFDMFGADHARRGKLFQESLTALRSIFDESAPSKTLRPQMSPLSPPPIWVGAWSPVGLKRAATLADGWIADPVRSAAEIEQMAKSYRHQLELSNAEGHLVVLREGWIGLTDDEARTLYYPIVAPIYRYYLEHNVIPESAGPPDIENLVNDRTLVGSSQSVADKITKLAAQTGADTIVLGIRQPGGPDHKEVLTCIERFGKEVAPRVREQLDNR